MPIEEESILAQESSETSIRVAIIEDRREIREGLATLIQFTDGFECTGKFATMEEAISRLRYDLPDIVLSDIGLPGIDGIEGVRILKREHPDLVILMLSVYEDNDRIFDALCAGAVGYLLKKTPPAILLDSLKEALAGGAPMSPEVARRVISLFREIRPPQRVDCELTPHEIRLLKLLVEGHSYKSAAIKLSVTVNTVAFHIKSIYDKLQVHSKSEAVAKALQNRLIA